MVRRNSVDRSRVRRFAACCRCVGHVAVDASVCLTNARLNVCNESLLIKKTRGKRRKILQTVAVRFLTRDCASFAPLNDSACEKKTRESLILSLSLHDVFFFFCYCTTPSTSSSNARRDFELCFWFIFKDKHKENEDRTNSI